LNYNETELKKITRQVQDLLRKFNPKKRIKTKETTTKQDKEFEEELWEGFKSEFEFTMPAKLIGFLGLEQSIADIFDKPNNLNRHRGTVPNFATFLSDKKYSAEEIMEFLVIYGGQMHTAGKASRGNVSADENGNMQHGPGFHNADRTVDTSNRPRNQSFENEKDYIKWGIRKLEITGADGKTLSPDQLEELYTSTKGFLMAQNANSAMNFVNEDGLIKNDKFYKKGQNPISKQKLEETFKKRS
jgi:hypothetical protein